MFALVETRENKGHPSDNSNRRIGTPAAIRPALAVKNVTLPRIIRLDRLPIGSFA